MNTATSYYELLANGILPEDVIERSRIDELQSDMMEFIHTLPMFQTWLATLERSDQLAMREGEDVPVIYTGQNISRHEARAIRDDPEVMLGFFRSMAIAITDSGLPMEEIFAIMTDAMYSMIHAHTTKIENVH
ncbi:hypothetical protein pEaSNUABM11_00017 [Erwinia phage pEa_SNUABM_11]|nr:hypothetical protein pEaSNUABM11_00017 [Erwinia phage pEa_SNUABM_11]